MSRIQPKKVYTHEFKFEAVRMLKEGDRTSTEISRSLGISRSMLYKWKDLFEEQGHQAFNSFECLSSVVAINFQTIIKPWRDTEIQDIHFLTEIL